MRKYSPLIKHYYSLLNIFYVYVIHFSLFGDEDVDLRTCIPPQILAVQQLQHKSQQDSKSPTPPPPPFITDEQNAESWNNLKVSTDTLVARVLNVHISKCCKYVSLYKYNQNCNFYYNVA